jgi:hypothetical protein
MSFLVGAAASPLVARAQQLLPVIGVVRIGKRGDGPHLENASTRLLPMAANHLIAGVSGG